MADKLEGLIISEILADNAGGSAFDTDGDGNANKADEYVEIQNTTGSTISLDGFELWSEKIGLLYAFGAADTIAAGDTATVVAEYTGTPPAGYYDAGEANNVNWLPDGEGQKFDSIFMVNSLTGEYVVLSYGNPPRTPTLPDGFPGTTRIGAGEQIDSSSPNGVAFARDADGDFEETTPTPDEPGVPCFCPGSMIETKTGPVAVENLDPGALLLTRDAGYVRLLAVRRVVLPARQVKAHPELWPIQVPKGTMSASHPMTVSPNHRFLISTPIAALLFSTSEVLVAAKYLGPQNVVRLNPQGRALVYYHLVLDHHAILQAHGLWTESLFLGDMITANPGHFAQWNVVPDVALCDIHHRTTARMVLKAHEAQMLQAAMNIHALRRVA